MPSLRERRFPRSCLQLNADRLDPVPDADDYLAARGVLVEDMVVQASLEAG